MPKQPLTIKKVLLMAITIGLITMVVTLVMQYKQNRVIEASKAAGYPAGPDIGAAHRYTTDTDGDHYYAPIKSGPPSSNKVEVWTRLVYSDEGKRSYSEKRKRNGMFVDGLDGLMQRTTRMELSCASNKKEYAVIEVFEVAKDGKTVDYARTGSSKNWENIPEGTFLEKLAEVACPRTAQ
jgi:hypothetical protein